jgi:hypothetical protein
MMRAAGSSIGLVAVLSFALAACAGGPMDDLPEDTATSSTDALTPWAFVRSDQVSFGRAPTNTSDLSSMVAPDFSGAQHSANEVIAWIDAHPKDEHPIYLGCIHTWVYDTDAAYRANVHTLVSKVHAATHHQLLVYFEEENASHAPHALSASHGAELRTLAKSATLLCATYANGQDSHSEVVAKVEHYKSHYHQALGVPMESLMIDVDTSQTPLSFYYGSRGDLANFDHVVGWALTAAYDQGFAGFHTFGNVGGKFGTERAANSTYAALDKDWKALVAAHPRQRFSGL